MRFHGLLVVRDEADIIGQSVRYALTWADAIYVYDTGSTDGTWEILKQIAGDDERLVLYGRESVYFRNDLRAVLFHKYRNRAEPGDWFATIDADEFYHTPPPRFVETSVRPHETAVCYQLHDFKLTREECVCLESRQAIDREREQPIENRRRYFVSLRYTEPRLFRYRRAMQWAPPNAPHNLGYISRERIPIRHYSNRDPLQMESRYRLRLQMRPYVGYAASPHWQVEDWRSLLADASSSELKYWKRGEELPGCHWTNHLAYPLKRSLQRAVHAGLLPVLDRLRRGFPAEYRPALIPPELDWQFQAARGVFESDTPGHSIEETAVGSLL